ncbi:hypothetical protein TVAG_292670 [Trichomonas vaginalis G3]|uniref:Uncharacterized protein n=1 Tax=Trichomonas vaginalis (strain ATCC PRA-98 / G3) TaxID=412133 RepID=A2F0D9_TRIV3|nr:hypothetical protein TVAGG3_0216540 [Trichomonas vaginalis G3]EAY01634.1 hypothetical protein TVAG_292670 [Trichomonas vaginalis G3]KAI5551599.1 hypothetical protein TVAGG3_0216540 [Trichomonas vaginalis G3]|eukprot:XP_001330366.1 hypothetical protein [Trichomonas vaginalis G3]
MSKNGKLFVTTMVVDRNPKSDARVGNVKRMKKELHELTISEIPIDMQDSMKTKTQLKISSRIKRVVHNQPKEPSVVEGKITDFQDSYTIRAFKEFLEEKGHYDISVFNNIPTTKECPNSLNETTCITPKHMLI